MNLFVRWGVALAFVASFATHELRVSFSPRAIASFSLDSGRSTACWGQHVPTAVLLSRTASADGPVRSAAVASFDGTLPAPSAAGAVPDSAPRPETDLICAPSLGRAPPAAR